MRPDEWYMVFAIVLCMVFLPLIGMTNAATKRHRDKLKHTQAQKPTGH